MTLFCIVVVMVIVASSDWSQEGISLADRRVYPSLVSLLSIPISNLFNNVAILGIISL